MRSNYFCWLVLSLILNKTSGHSKIRNERQAPEVNTDMIADLILLRNSSESEFGIKFDENVYKAICTSSSRTVSLGNLNKFLRIHFGPGVVLEQKITITTCS